MKPINNYGLSDSLIDTVRKAVREALVGGQKKLDVDKDGKLEKTDFASLRAKKDAVDTKPKLKEDHPDEKEDKALIKKLIKKADVSDDEEDKALIKKTMNKEDVEQLVELFDNNDVFPYLDYEDDEDNDFSFNYIIAPRTRSRRRRRRRRRPRLLLRAT